MTAQLLDQDLKLHDEPARLAALHRYEILDTPKEAQFDRITALVEKVLNVPMCAVSLVDTNRQWFKSCVGLSVSETDRSISFCTHTIQTREPLHITDATLDERFANNALVTGPPSIRSYLGIPLSTPDGYNIGSLCAIDTRPRTFGPDQIAVLRSFADVVLDELELRRIVQTDHLTGAATRRSFCLELEKAIAQHRRSAAPATLIMFDVDHFKLVNDTYGHPAGDNVLRAVTAALMAELRVNDALGRLGGEEFGVLLRESSPLHAMEIAERFRRIIEATEVANDPPLRVTASFGIAPLVETNVTAEKWMQIADEALYRAKRTGRNRCCAASPPEAEVRETGALELVSGSVSA